VHGHPRAESRFVDRGSEWPACLAARGSQVMDRGNSWLVSVFVAQESLIHILAPRPRGQSMIEVGTEWEASDALEQDRGGDAVARYG
jgi:hypothetical protein